MRSRQHLIRHALGVLVLAILLVLSAAGTSSRAYAGVDFAVAALCFGSELPSPSVWRSSSEQAQRQVIAHKSYGLGACVDRSQGESLAAPSCNASAAGRAPRERYLQFCSWLC